jgi:pantoate--beta-alanine ligase
MEGRRIALVPTMGYLHEGHLSLMAEAKRLGADEIVVSVFVNPVQFGPNEDFDKYPRDEKADLAKCRRAGVTAVFLPAPAGMYPDRHSTYVDEESLSGGLCGARRPGHFRGVCTVVAKLFNLVHPHFAVFGQKDYQQAAVIRRMVRDLNFDLDVVVATSAFGMGVDKADIRFVVHHRAPDIVQHIFQLIGFFKYSHKETFLLRKIIFRIIAQPLSNCNYNQRLPRAANRPRNDINNYC